MIGEVVETSASFEARFRATTLPDPEVILRAVRWYLGYSLSYRDVQELLIERGLEVAHTTIWRWVQRDAPELDERTRPHLKPTHKSWRVDETYVSIRAFGPRKFMKNSG